MHPTTEQLAWALASLALLAGSLAAAWVAVWRPSAAVRRTGRLLLAGALLIDVGLVGYRSATTRECPIRNLFDSALLFASLLGGLLLYLLATGRRRGRESARERRPVIDAILLPLVVLMQLVSVAIYFGGFREFPFRTAWQWTHLGSLIIASLFLATAGVGGALYLVLDRSLRRKRMEVVLSGGLPSLERIESLVGRAVNAGFFLLTVGMLAGLMIAIDKRLTGVQLLRWPKIWFDVATWVVYLVMMCRGAMPRLRGRWMAWLSMAGFLLLLGAYFAAQRWPLATVQH